MTKFSLAGVIGIVVLCAITWGDDERKLPFTVGKETTGIVWPLQKDGRPDYVRAINEKYGKGVTAENNAFVAWLAVGGVDMLPEKTRKETLRLCGAENIGEGEGLTWESYSSFVKNRNGELTQKYMDDEDAARKTLWAKSDLPEMAEYLEKMGNILDGTKAAFERPRYWLPWVGTSMFEREIGGGEMRLFYTARCLVMRGMMRAKEENFAGFKSDCMAAKRIARRLTSSGSMVDHLVALSLDASATQAMGVAAGEGIFTAEQCRELAAALDEMGPMPTGREYVDVEARWRRLEFVLDVATGKFERIEELRKELSMVGGPVEPDWTKVEAEAVNWDIVLKRVNETIDMAAAINADRSVADLQKAWKTYDEEGGPLEQDVSRRTNETEAEYTKRIVERIARNGTSHLMQTEVLRRMAVMQDQMLRAVVGAAWYKAEKGEWPEKLNDVAPKYLKQIPEDIFAEGDEKEVQYVWTDKGATVKSAGNRGRYDVGVK